MLKMMALAGFYDPLGPSAPPPPPTPPTPQSRPTLVSVAVWLSDAIFRQTNFFIKAPARFP